MILITHDEKVAAHAKRIIKLQDGKIISDEAPHDIQAMQVEQKTSEPRAAGLTAEGMEAVKTALRALRVNLFRAALTLLGIIIGVAAVVTMLAVGDGSKQKVLSQISAMGTNL